MKAIENATLSEILPANLMADEQIAAMAAALDKMLSDLTADIKQVIHLPRLDELSGTVLDLLANQFHVDHWEPLWLDDETKRNLIRESIATHRLYGTKAALEMANRAFNREVKIEEWWEYSGQPYGFRLRTKPFFKASDQDAWFRMIGHVKSVRDWVEVIFEAQKETPLYVGIGQWRHGTKRRKMSAEYEVGRITTTIQDGARTLEISATEVIISYGAEREVIPLGNLFGDVLKMRFSSANSERILTIENPREDLTPAEVQEVADYVTENEIILDATGETTNELKRATLYSTTVQILF